MYFTRIPSPLPARRTICHVIAPSGIGHQLSLTHSGRGWFSLVTHRHHHNHNQILLIFSASAPVKTTHPVMVVMRKTWLACLLHRKPHAENEFILVELVGVMQTLVDAMVLDWTGLSLSGTRRSQDKKTHGLAVSLRRLPGRMKKRMRRQ